jgi:murein L,D-transpeptidase YcbB/YkuD
MVAFRTFRRMGFHKGRARAIPAAMLILAVLIPPVLPCGAAAQSLTDQLDEALRTSLEAEGGPPQLCVGDEPIHACGALQAFYERRAYRPAWISDAGPRPQADSLVAAVREAPAEGLNPYDYHLKWIETLLKKTREKWQLEGALQLGELTNLEFLLTDAFLVYGSHLLAGRVNPETIGPEWIANRRGADLTLVLDGALADNRIGEALEGLLPRQKGYNLLKRALAHYRVLAEKGGWPSVTAAEKIQKGDRGSPVAALRGRLAATLDLEGGPPGDSELFDEGLEGAVIKFQLRHGLAPDGVVGARTLEALNVPVESRVRQIEINMERWRWLPQELGVRHIIINIANFELDVIDSGSTVMTMRVIVGRHYRRTPVFSDKMTYLVFCPYWNVPPGIAASDVLPEIRKDPTYLAKKNMKVFLGWGADAREIDPASVDWSAVGAAGSGYRFRQEPGPDNSLGRVKFMFPNKFNVYLHDTPARDLFEKTERAFSSGCIRIEKPLELADYVLRGDPKWTPDRILAAIDRWKEQTVPLPEPINVHMLYWTAWADAKGTVQFRKDIYDRDSRLDQALREPAPTL